MSKVGANTQMHRSGSAKIGRQFRHDFRKNNTYRNCHVDKTLSYRNVIFKEPEGTYTEDYEKMKNDGKVKEAGLKEDGCNILSTVIDVESKYFDNDYEKAKEFFALEYNVFKEKFGEENILGAVMHADERYIDAGTGKEYVHYHLHIVYVPVAIKEKRFSRATAKKDPELYERDSEGNVIMVTESKKGKEQLVPLTKVKERVNQVSHTNCMAQRFETEDTRVAYQRLQDMVWEAVRERFPDIERGEKKTNRAELETLEYSAKKEREAKKILQNQLDGYEEKMSFGLDGDFEEIIEEVHVPGLREQVSEAEEQLDLVKGRIKDLKTEYEEAVIKYDKNSLEGEIEVLKKEKETLQHDVKSLKEKLNDYIGIIKKAIKGLWVACRTGLLQAEDDEKTALLTVKKGQEEAHVTVKPLDEVVRENVDQSIDGLAEETNEQIRSFRKRGR